MEKYSLAAIALIAFVLVGSIVYFSPNLFRATVLSVSQINIDPQGYEDSTTKEWRGSFWTIIMTTDCTDQVSAYKFDKTESEKGTNTIGDKKLVPQSTVTIKIDPQQPYWERPLEIKSVTVTPKTFGMGRNKLAGAAWKWTDTGIPVGAVYSNHYEWGTGYWIVHTPFIVTILKNDVQIGQKIIDTIGATSIIRIPDSGDEYVAISDLGKLGTGYGEPQLGDIMFFSMDNVFEKTTASYNLVKYDGGGSYSDAVWAEQKVTGTQSYSTYWFGTSRWNDDKSPQAWRPFGDDWDFYGTGDIGGWIRADDTWNHRAKPVQPKVLERADPSFMSLVEYLSSKNVAEKDLHVWKQAKSPEIVSESVTGSKKLRVYLPFGSVNSLIKVQISTELADTIVWQPQVANIKITSMPDLGDIGDRKTGTITIKQESTVASSGTVSLTVSPTTAPLSINPPSQGTGAMNPLDIKTLTYEVLNLGCTEDTSFTITATVTNSLGATTDTESVTGTLKPKGSGETVLTVYTYDDETKEKVSGVQITAVFDSQSKSGITSDGSITWNLGSAQPSVTITSAETLTYKSKTVTKQLVAGINSVEIWLIKQGEDGKSWLEQYWWLVLVAVVIVVVIFVVIVAYKKEWI